MEQYAIRPTFRNHNTLQRGDVIQKIASLVGPKHKVNLTKPDKVILVEVSTVCFSPLAPTINPSSLRASLSYMLQL